MANIPTAEEMFKANPILPEGVERQACIAFMKTFAKLHVEAALKEASEKATVTPIDFEEISEGSFRPIWGVDDDSILNSYSLDNIK